MIYNSKLLAFFFFKYSFKGSISPIGLSSLFCIYKSSSYSSSSIPGIGIIRSLSNIVLIFSFSPSAYRHTIRLNPTSKSGVSFIISSYTSIALPNLFYFTKARPTFFFILSFMSLFYYVVESRAILYILIA